MAIQEKFEFIIRRKTEGAWSTESTNSPSNEIQTAFSASHTLADLFRFCQEKFEIGESTTSECHLSFQKADGTVLASYVAQYMTVVTPLKDVECLNSLRPNILVVETFEKMSVSNIANVDKSVDTKVQEEDWDAEATPPSNVRGRTNPMHGLGGGDAVPSCSNADQQNSAECTSTPLVLRQPNGFVGLVNQAATCYLNSLIQTLYMTPEFRNAVYNWEYSVSHESERKSIPYQLQKLFLLLQTSDKPALETKDLTKSFGWDSSHAWDQHDVQELCRVMFEALEVKWRKTTQATVINKLYQGTLKDYVKCLECGNENARDDVFLDLPLAIKPFGSHQAYSSVLDALKGFVQFEVLEGSNQYSCSNCKKKCNAHKGLKVTKFPYLLTIQLKRFDFDYTTLHRIKLNDRMTFPDILNLNPFIQENSNFNDPEAASISQQPNVEGDNADVPQPLVDDGVVDDVNNEGQALDLARVESDDEGICLESNGALNGTSCTTSPAESEINECDSNLINENIDPSLIDRYLTEGPFVYELFSIMVHSGSANGGHYYAYIKNLDSKIWYCFNDQVVTRASIEDIKKTYGGATSSYLYSYSSSTNAYMLMYRQIDKERNVKFMENEQLPEHLLKMLKQVSIEEADQRCVEERQRLMTSYKVYCFHPDTSKIIEQDLEVKKNATTLEQLTDTAYKAFRMGDYDIPLDRCRLVKFAKYNEYLESSFETEDLKKAVTNLLPWFNAELFLEVRPEHVKFRSYTNNICGGITLKVYRIILDGEGDMDNYFLFFINASATVGQLRNLLAEYLICDEHTLVIVLDKHSNSFRLLDDMEKRMDVELGASRSAKVYVATVQSIDEIEASSDDVVGCSSSHNRRVSIDEKMIRFEKTTFYQILDRHKNMVKLKLYLPNVNECQEHLNNSLFSIDDEEDNSTSYDASVSPPSYTPSYGVIPPAPPLPPLPASFCCNLTVLPTLATEERSAASTQYVTPVSSRSATPEHTSLSMAATPSPQVSPDSNSPLGLFNASPVSAGDMPPPLLDPLMGTPDFSHREKYSKMNVDDVVGGDYSKSDAVFRTTNEESPLTTLGRLDEKGMERLFCVNRRNDVQQVVEVDSNVVEEEDSSMSDETTDFYFEAIPVKDDSEKTAEQMFEVNCDGRMPVEIFKTKLAPLVGTRPEQFKIFKVYSSNEYVWSSITDCVKDACGTIGLRVKLGRPLKDDESLMKVYLFDYKEFQPKNFLFDMVLKKRAKISHMKLMAKELLKRKRGLEVEVDRMRFRCVGSSGRVDFLRADYCEHFSWGHHSSSNEIHLQILDEPSDVDNDSLLVFVRRWHPNTSSFGRINEISLKKKSTFSEFRQKLSRLSSIPECNIELTRPFDSGVFPFEVPKLKLLEETTFYDCVEDDGPIDELPININGDGCLIYYRDSREPAKTLTEEERKELQIKDNVRFRRTSYTWRKERALKIYTEISSSLQNDEMS